MKEPITTATEPAIALLHWGNWKGLIFEDGEASGGVVVPRADVTALAIALGRVLDDEAWGREMGKRARCRVEECFSLEAVGKQLREFLLKKATRNRVEPKKV